MFVDNVEGGVHCKRGTSFLGPEGPEFSAYRGSKVLKGKSIQRLRE